MPCILCANVRWCIVHECNPKIKKIKTVKQCGGWSTESQAYISLELPVTVCVFILKGIIRH